MLMTDVQLSTWMNYIDTGIVIAVLIAAVITLLHLLITYVFNDVLTLHTRVILNSTYDFHVIDETVPMGPCIFRFTRERSYVNLLRSIKIV